MTLDTEQAPPVKSSHLSTCSRLHRCNFICVTNRDEASDALGEAWYLLWLLVNMIIAPRVSNQAIYPLGRFHPNRRNDSVKGAECPKPSATSRELSVSAGAATLERQVYRLVTDVQLRLPGGTGWQEICQLVVGRTTQQGSGNGISIMLQ